MLILLRPGLSHLQCKETNVTLENGYLIGKWYVVAKFMNTRAWRHSCMPMEFKRVEDKYAKYCRRTSYTANETNYSFESDCVEMLSGKYEYPRDVLVGSGELKYFLRYPFAGNYLQGLRVFKRVNDNYLLYNECPNRFNYTILLSRHEEPEEDELNAIVGTLEEVKHLIATTYCYRNAPTGKPKTPKERMAEILALLKTRRRQRALANSNISD